MVLRQLVTFSCSRSMILLCEAMRLYNESCTFNLWSPDRSEYRVSESDTLVL